jgi:hypothetical protein
MFNHTKVSNNLPESGVEDECAPAISIVVAADGLVVVEVM